MMQSSVISAHAGSYGNPMAGATYAYPHLILHPQTIDSYPTKLTPVGGGMTTGTARGVVAPLACNRHHDLLRKEVVSLH